MIWQQPDITFDGSSKTESVSYDYVQLFYTLNGTTYSAGKFGGSDIAGKTIVLPTTDFYLYWKTDSSSDGYYGYKATVTPTNDAAVTGSVASLPSGVTVKEATSVSDLESKHGNYGNNVKELQDCSGTCVRENSNINNKRHSFYGNVIQIRMTQRTVYIEMCTLFFFCEISIKHLTG